MNKKINDGVNTRDVKPCIMYRVGNLIDRQDAAASDVGLFFPSSSSLRSPSIRCGSGKLSVVSLEVCFKEFESISHQTIDNNNLSVVFD